MLRSFALVVCLSLLLSCFACGRNKPSGSVEKTAELTAWTMHGFEKTVVNKAPKGSLSTDYTVYLAKGETEGCQVAVYSDAEFKNVTFSMTSGETEKIETTIYSMNRSHAIGRKQYTDSLIPYQGKSLTLKKNVALPFMLEYKTNENTPAGEYKYAYQLKNESGKTVAVFNITVHVWDFELPKEKTFVTAFGLAKHWIAYMGLYNSDIHAVWYDMMLDHNMSAYNIPYDILDERANAYMSDPRVTSFEVPLPKTENGAIDEEKLLATYNKLLTNEAWLKKAYFYPLDEAHTKDQLEELKMWEETLRKLCPEIEIMSPFYTNIQIGDGRDQTDFMEEITDLWCPKLCLWDDKRAYGDFLNYTPSKSFAERMAEQQAKGDRVWAYVCNDPDDPYAQLFVDTEGVNQRLMFWQLYQRNIEGFLYWSVNFYGYKEGNEFMNNATPQNPWETINTKVTNGQGKTIYGCGFLFYPGRDVRAGVAVPSIRAKIVRDGIDEIEMFYLAEKCLGKDWIIEKTKEGTPTLTEYVSGDEYIKLRTEIGNALEAALKK